MDRITVAALQQMKQERRKIVGVVVYDVQMARIADRAGVDIVSVGDSVGVNIWGHASENEVTLEQMLLACTAVRRGVERALVSCDVPPAADAVTAAQVLVKEGGADLVKVEAGPGTIRTIVDAGIPVWAQLSGQWAVGSGQQPAGSGQSIVDSGQISGQSAVGSGQEIAGLVEQAKAFEAAGASMLDFRHSGSVAGPAVAAAVSIPVIGGLGGGPWLDGRVRAIVNAIGYSAAALDDHADRYANVARVALDAIASYADDVRRGRQVRGK
ncbi:MAG TPA: 3-methyl-2-oxobutanoate hydroxymethyltransferase [Vicinamibacterales bacterium]|nr:3-methyl-2-oxobutanoate hydroxymethyltransferase [Vicinamibacterales bacterium]